MSYRKDKSQIQGLTDLASKLPQHCRMAEIGSAYGESARIFLLSGRVATLYAIDPWQGKPTSAEEERAFDALCRQFPERIVKLRLSSAIAAQEFTNDASLDFVYIDANHQYKSVKQDIQLWLPKIRAGGLIGGHDMSDRFPGVGLAVSECLTDAIRANGCYLFEDNSWLVRL